jgi:hypothetical protein
MHCQFQSQAPSKFLRYGVCTLPKGIRSLFITLGHDDGPRMKRRSAMKRPSAIIISHPPSASMEEGERPPRTLLPPKLGASSGRYGAPDRPGRLSWGMRICASSLNCPAGRGFPASHRRVRGRPAVADSRARCLLAAAARCRTDFSDSDFYAYHFSNFAAKLSHETGILGLGESRSCHGHHLRLGDLPVRTYVPGLPSFIAFHPPALVRGGQAGKQRPRVVLHWQLHSGNGA